MPPTGTEGEKVLAVYNSRDDWSQSAYACDQDERIICRAGTPWLCVLRDSGGEGKDARELSHLSLLRAATGERIPVCELEGSPDLYPVPTEDGNGLLICAVKGRDNRLLVVDPELLTASDRLQTVAYHPEPDPLPEPEYPDYLAELRAMADRMEADYGVTIHFGDAVLGWTDGDFPIVTPSGAYKDHEISMLQKTLECLDRTLASYPDDFTAHFRNFRGQGGLRFFLATEFRSETESFLPSGTMYPSGGWYNINLTLVDCTEKVIHHEIWHAVDCYLSGEGRAVDEDVWYGMNPEGFAYGNDRNSYQDDESAAAFTLESD